MMWSLIAEPNQLTSISDKEGNVAEAELKHTWRPIPGEEKQSQQLQETDL